MKQAYIFVEREITALNNLRFSQDKECTINFKCIPLMLLSMYTLKITELGNFSGKASIQIVEIMG